MHGAVMVMQPLIREGQEAGRQGKVLEGQEWHTMRIWKYEGGR
jgi:hypothetical protein